MDTKKVIISAWNEPNVFGIISSKKDEGFTETLASSSEKHSYKYYDLIIEEDRILVDDFFSGALTLAK